MAVSKSTEGRAEDQVVRLEGERLTMGRGNGNDIVLEDVNVSRFHAEIVFVGGNIELRDLDSRCGTRVNGRPVKTAIIRDGAEIGVGSHRLRFDGSGVASRDERGTLSLEVRDVSVKVEGKTILNRVSLAIEPGQLVAIIGASGAGKSTLLKSMAGVRRPSAGEVTLNGDPVTARLTDVGYVPQDEIVHGLLTAEEALRYAAKLRLPDDTEAAVIRSTVRRVITELSLEGRGDTRVASLSGGERKRTGVGSELVNRPSLLFLDEPTTGLDPELESQAMRLFRDLADPDERAVVLVTHATKNLELCDRVIVMAEGGELAFFGAPAQALTFFEVESYDDIYAALARTPSREWRDRFAQNRPRVPQPGLDSEPPQPGATGSSRAKLGFLPQVGVLTGRYGRLLVRDGRNLLILLGQVPIIGLAIAFLFKTGLFLQRDDGIGAIPGNPNEQIQLLFLLSTTAIWLGSIDASREIVKERSVNAREMDVGVRVGAYLTSKAIILFSLAAAQTMALALFVFLVRPLEEPTSTYAVVVVLLVLTSWVGIGIGLVISAAVRTEDQATSFIPLTLIPQLLFAGAVVPVARMAEPIASLTYAVPTRWSLAGVGAAVDMNDRLAGTKTSKAVGYGRDFFDIRPVQAGLILVAFLLLTLGITAALAGRRRDL